ncbi:deoxyribose-phosphate aldolase [Pelosinus propionicus]|uniref:Deoxyribose-phosphate aldolase n=1 Tax=Pelosinus propionicus DSM 13327 TaxID=1123291 RepID=A0A1I4J0Z6_9FIRM|nr:deoxyribose-phosphate aldolase [Pelosinus propionicus]SFL59883.1 deoxyribose-phosphate aldolase [Pelosinus propionicus DSM 13327]
MNTYIDHTLLKPDATPHDIRCLCREAAEYKFAAVCINPCYVDLAVSLLVGTGVKVATVIGFPLGANLSIVKAFEAKQAVLHGADELDMVINIGAAKLGLWEAVLYDIQQVLAEGQGRIVKVIVETGLLTEEEKERVCHIVLESGAQFIKTSTGFAKGGATLADIRLFKSIIGERIGIKASGGIRTSEEAAAMIAAGATRIGTSNGIAIVS